MKNDPSSDKMLAAAKINTPLPGLVFDDEPVDSIIYDEKIQTPTPADIIEQWSYTDSRYISTEAVAKILCNYPDAASGIKDNKKGEKCFWNALESLEDDPECIKTAIFLAALSSLYRGQRYQHLAVNLQRCAAELWLKNGQQNDEPPVDIINNYFALLESAKNFEEANKFRRRCQVEELFKRGDQNSLIKLRTMALNLFKKKNYQESIVIYRRLLEKGFELPGTLSHLARILLAIPDQDNRKEAKNLLEKAWENRNAAPAYVPPRILLWQTLLNFLDGDKSINTTGKLKTLLQTDVEAIFQEYYSAPVLDRWKDQLLPDDYSFLDALASALNDCINFSALNKFAQWTE